MAAPTFTMRQLLEAGVHFGHHTRRWNPKMEHFIFGQRNGIHILDLQQTVPLLGHALIALREKAAKGGRILFVGTKRVASEKIAATALACGQYYVNHRWLGGMLTNWATVSQSIRRLRELETRLAEDDLSQLGKKEILQLTRERDKLELTLGGIKEMGGLPDILFILDTNKEDIAVLEANKLGIPVVGVIDSNASPVGIDYPIPGNDDAMRAIALYCELVQGAILDGLQEELRARGADMGAQAQAPHEPGLAVDNQARPQKRNKAGDMPAKTTSSKVEVINKADALKAEALKVDAPKAEAPKADDAKAETPKADDAKVEAPKADDAKVGAPKGDDAKAEAPKGDDAKAEAPKAEIPESKVASA